jgi:hypothetical protein
MFAMSSLKFLIIVPFTELLKKPKISLISDYYYPIYFSDVVFDFYMKTAKMQSFFASLRENILILSYLLQVIKHTFNYLTRNNMSFMKH